MIFDLFSKTDIMNKNEPKTPATESSDLANINPVKDPGDWTTGDEEMTGPQLSYLHTLAREAGETIDESMTKAEASMKIEELQEKTGRGK